MSKPSTQSDWCHPRIINPEAAKTFWSEIASEANKALWRRRDAYPAQVSAGKMSDEDAAKDIAAWAEIARDWDWICTGIGAPASCETLDDRIAALDTAIARYFQVIDTSAVVIDEVLVQGSMLAAMRWWAERERWPDFRSHVRWLASVGHSWRETSIDTDAHERKAA
jgi:hypothetical protein